MAHDNPDDLRGRPKMAHAIRTMPKWKWTLLGFSLVLGCVGLIGQGASMFLRTPAPSQKSTVSVQSKPAPPGSSGFMSGQPTAAVQEQTSNAPATPQPSFTDALTPFMSKFGFSLFVGVTVGLIFRTFLRMTALFIALIVAFLLSYQCGLNVLQSRYIAGEFVVDGPGLQIARYHFQCVALQHGGHRGILSGI